MQHTGKCLFGLLKKLLKALDLKLTLRYIIIVLIESETVLIQKTFISHIQEVFL